MKKLAFVLVALFMIPLQACAQAKWVEGTHYKVISDTATKKPEVTEFFSFWCPACYRFEPLVEVIKEKLADDVAFKKVHVNFMGMAGPTVQDQATRAMAIGTVLKQSDAMNKAIFDYIHQQRATITGLDDLRALFIANGVAADKFDKLAKSFGVNSMVMKNNKQIEKYRSHLSGVPNFIVNGKYQATFTRDMTQDDIINLIVWLSTQS